MKKLKFLLAICIFPAILIAQTNPPFWDDIQKFKKQDSIDFPGRGKILFVGSSSFTKWTDVQDYFQGYAIVNSGFGGSTLVDVIRYRDDVIFPYKPKQIVIYCGENDLASSDTVSANMVVERFKELYSLIREKYKKVPVAFISLKPSPSRQHLMLKMELANKGIKDFLQEKPRAAFIDVYHSMLKPNGQPMDDIFIDDRLHMNAKGYAIWKDIIQPYLLH